jgi:hypothetical protein
LATTATNASGTKQSIPFRAASARHRKSSVYTIPWASGSRVSLGLNNIGYQNELQIKLNLTLTVSGSGTVTDAANAVSNYLPIIGLRSPQGEYIWSTNSRDLFDFQYRYWDSVTPSSDPSYATWSPASATAQNVQLRLRIPTAINDGTNFDFGMLMRQISNNQFYLDLNMANLTSDLQGAGSCTISSITGTITVEEIYYDAVQDPRVIPPNFNQYIRLRSAQSPSLITGLNDVRYDTGPVIMDALHRIMNNGAADGTIANVAYIQTLANKGNEIDNRTGDRLAFDSTMHLGKNFRAGCYHLDFCDDADLVNATKGRDLINSNLAAQLDFMIQYGGTPSGSSNINTVYREIVTLGA